MINYEALTNEELVYLYRKEPPSADRTSERDEYALFILLKKNRRFLVWRINKIKGGYDYYGVRYDELICEAETGLWIAAERFDPAKEVKFLTYAGEWVDKEIRSFLEKESKHKKRKGTVTKQLEESAAERTGLRQCNYPTEVYAINKRFMEVFFACMRTMDIRSQIIVCLGNGLYGCTPLTTQELAKFSNTKEKVIKKNENEIYQKLYRLLIDKCAGIKEIDRIRRDNKAASEKKTRDTVKNRRTLLTDKEHRRLLDEARNEKTTASAERIPALYANDDPETVGEAEKIYFLRYSDGSRVYIPPEHNSIYTQPEFNKWRILFKDKDEEWVRERYNTLMSGKVIRLEWD